jgi:glycosyltransferase involved in cell wall biosynthesis
MRIGVVTPAFNAGTTLHATIASVLAQNHADWRMVVVDDGSTDATAAIARSIRDPRLIVVAQPNLGVSAARNRGLTAIDAEAFLFLDADDLLAPDALDRLDETLAACPRAAAAVGPYRFVERGLAGRTRRPPEGALLPALLRRNRFVNGGQVLVRASAIAAAGPFDTTLRYGEDWEFWIRIALAGDYAAVFGRAPVLHVRQQPDGAYARFAADPASFEPCMAAVFGNPAILARLGAARLAALREAAVAENAWVVGRELIRHRRVAEGLRWLRRSVRLRPTPRRIALLAAARVLLSLPPELQGALRPYAGGPLLSSPGLADRRTRAGC